MTSKDLERRQDGATLVERLQKCSAHDAPTWPVDHLLMREAADALQSLQAENERLTERVAAFTALWNQQQSRAESAERERDALKADAERYRFLRDAHPNCNLFIKDDRDHCLRVIGTPMLDAAIDAARSLLARPNGDSK